MKIPTDLTPLGPEMAFEMPDGEVLPMWVRDSDIESWRIAGIKVLDSRWAITSIGTQWFQCALLEGHPIPESALVNKPDRLMHTMRLSELAMSPSDHQEPPPPKQPLFTPTERRDRVWELAARLCVSHDTMREKTCIAWAEMIMVEFEATYNKEGEQCPR